MKVTIKTAKLNEIKPNKDNPRILRDEKFKKLKQSIQDFPEMLELREVVVDEDMIILGGNMRYRALQDLGIKEAQIKIVEGLSEEQKKEFIIKDNVGFGDWDWDILANEWDTTELEDWGLDLPFSKDENNSKFSEDVESDEEFQLYQYNEFAIFPKTNKYNIPDLLENKLYKGDLDDVIWSHNDEDIQENKTYLAMYGQLAVDERLKDKVIGFFVDDSRFEVVWNEAVKILYKFDNIQPKALLTPNFSLWADEPIPFQIMAWYKTMWCGRYWQEAGYEIIPTLNWSTEESFEFCFLGLPKYLPTAIIQTRNIKTKKEFNSFKKGIRELQKKVEIGTLFIYGTENKEIDEVLSGINFKRIRPWTEKKALQNKKKDI
jgi:hypothetical protein